MLAGFGILAADRAHAFTPLDCASHPGDAACRELLRHKTLVADLEKDIEKRGLSPAQRQAILAKAVCPFCGELLIG
jgi:hypothetical protein